MDERKKHQHKNANHHLFKETNLTYSDYAALDDGNRYELSDGQLEFMSPVPTVTHQMISFQIQKEITDCCEKDYIILNAPIDVILYLLHIYLIMR